MVRRALHLQFPVKCFPIPSLFLSPYPPLSSHWHEFLPSPSDEWQESPLFSLPAPPTTSTASEEQRTLDTKQGKVVKITGLRQQAIDQSRVINRGRETPSESWTSESRTGTAGGGGAALILENKPLSILRQSTCWMWTTPSRQVVSNVQKLRSNILS